MAETKIWVLLTTPVRGLMISMVCPAKSTKVFSAGFVLETHDDTLPACPGPIELAEPGVAIPVGVLLMVFDQRSRNVTPLRASSWWTRSQSGSALPFLTSTGGRDRGKSKASRFSALMPSGRGHVMPSSLARWIYF